MVLLLAQHTGLPRPQPSYNGVATNLMTIDDPGAWITDFDSRSCHLRRRVSFLLSFRRLDESSILDDCWLNVPVNCTVDC